MSPLDISSALWGFTGTVVGGIIGFASAYMATTRTIESQKAIQNVKFTREDEAVRAIEIALLLDLYRFVQDAARNAVFEPEKWTRPLQRFLDLNARTEIGQALTHEQVRAVLKAGFDVDLAFNQLSEEIKGKDLPFNDGYEERHPGGDLDHAEHLYITRIWILSRNAYQAMNRALRAMRLDKHIDQTPSPSMIDVRDDYRSQLGRMPAEPLEEADANERVWDERELFG